MQILEDLSLKSCLELDEESWVRSLEITVFYIQWQHACCL